MADEKPILFSTSLVPKIIDGTKNCTRRVMSGMPRDFFDPARPVEIGAVALSQRDDGGGVRAWPYGYRGLRRCPYDAERLWVREAWAKAGGDVLYRARGDRWAYGWKPGIHLRRIDARLTLHGVSVRVERLQDISEEDARAEGVEAAHDGSCVNAFRWLWQSINGKRPGRSWDDNPHVWVVRWTRAEVRR